jgi:hypothetical protein
MAKNMSFIKSLLLMKNPKHSQFGEIQIDPLSFASVSSIPIGNTDKVWNNQG